MQNGDGIFLVVVLAAIVSNGASWWFLITSKLSAETTRGILTIGGVVANSAAALYPVLFAFWEPVQTHMGTNTMLPTVLALCIFSFLAGFFAQGSLQAMMFLSSISTAAFWLMVPHGVL
jgi:hypothetical protein